MGAFRIGTHFGCGHPADEANTKLNIVRGTTYRMCRTCHNKHARESMARKRDRSYSQASGLSIEDREERLRNLVVWAQKQNRKGLDLTPAQRAEIAQLRAEIAQLKRGTVA